ncbi:hypothetical protein V1477_014291 [Vespula maculifrons]|uniref:Uncharacterized protein n=1 Tax=Vespula maculifrons TaxID=7453 RepID=A0ABD2BLU5_VESMC
MFNITEISKTPEPRRSSTRVGKLALVDEERYYVEREGVPLWRPKSSGSNSYSSSSDGSDDDGGSGGGDGDGDGDGPSSRRISIGKQNRSVGTRTPARKMNKITQKERKFGEREAARG